MAKTVWKDRKRTLFGLPWSFTRYYLTEDKLIIFAVTGKAVSGDIGYFIR